MALLLALPVCTCFPSVAYWRIPYAKTGFPVLPTMKALYPAPYLGLGYAKFTSVPYVSGLGACNPLTFCMKVVMPTVQRLLSLPATKP